MPIQTKHIVDKYKLNNRKIGVLPIEKTIKYEIKNIIIKEFVNKPNKGWSTGFKEFDNTINGISDMTVIAGSPGSGKSTITRWLSLQFLKSNENNKVLYMSAEDTIDDFLKVLNPLILNINSKVYNCDFANIFKHTKTHSFSEFFLDRMAELAETDPELYGEYISLVNRFEYKTKGDNVFSSKEDFVHYIIDTILGYTNPFESKEPLNELLVVLDHLGEFNFIDKDEEYTRLNDIMEAIMTMTGGYITACQKELGDIDTNPFVYNIREKIQTEEDMNKLDILSSRLKNKYSRLISNRDWDGFFNEIMEECNLPRVKFLLLSQFKSTAYESGKWQKKTYDLNVSDLESSKRLGQRAIQVFYVWKEFVPKPLITHYSDNKNILKQQLKDMVKPLPELTYIYCPKGRGNMSDIIYPCLTNLSTGMVIPFQVETQPAKGVLFKSNIEDFRKVIGIEYEKATPTNKGDTHDTWYQRYKTFLSNISSGYSIIKRDTFEEEFTKKIEEQNKFFKAFQMDKLYDF